MKWKRSMIAFAIVIPVVLLLAWGFRFDPREIDSPLPGKPAPPFALQVFSPGVEPLARKVGDTIDVGALRGKVVVLNFWASWCVACRQEHKILSETALTYAGAPVQFLGVLYRDLPAPAIGWIQEMGGQTYPSINDPDAHMAIDYGLYGVPETFFIDPHGVIAYKHVGPVTEDVLRKWVDSLSVKTAAGDTAVAKRGN